MDLGRRSRRGVTRARKVREEGEEAGRRGPRVSGGAHCERAERATRATRQCADVRAQAVSESATRCGERAAARARAGPRAEVWVGLRGSGPRVKDGLGCFGFGSSFHFYFYSISKQSKTISIQTKFEFNNFMHTSK